MIYYIVFNDSIYSFNKLIHLQNWYVANQDYQCLPEEFNGVKLGPYLTLETLSLETIAAMKQYASIEKKASKIKPKKPRYKNRRRR